MKHKRFNLFGLNTSWVGLLNRIILQWFFVRLQMSIINSNIDGFQLIGFIVPMTGWSIDYKYVIKNFQLSLWEAK